MTVDPAERDRRNAATRAEIASRQNQEYQQVLALATAAFGKGWHPAGRHYLLDKADETEARRTGTRPKAAATCFTVRNDQGERKHFTVDAAGQVTEQTSYEVAFGNMLSERHPTMRIEIAGELVAPFRFSLCWSATEQYFPRTADQLAANRVRREERAVEKAAQAMPLFAEQIRAGEIEPEGRRRVR